MDLSNNPSNNRLISSPNKSTKRKSIGHEKILALLKARGKLTSPGSLGTGIDGRNGWGGEFIELEEISPKKNGKNQINEWFTKKLTPKNDKTSEGMKNLELTAKRKSKQSIQEIQKEALKNSSIRNREGLQNRRNFYNAENENFEEFDGQEEVEVDDEWDEEEIICDDEDESLDEEEQEIEELEDKILEDIPNEEVDTMQIEEEESCSKLELLGPKCIVSDDESDFERDENKSNFETESENSTLEDEEDPFKLKAKKKAKKENLAIDTYEINEAFKQSQDDDQSIATPVLPSQPFDIFADLSHKNYLKVNENCDFLQEKKNPTFSQAISGHTQDLEDALQFCSGTFDSDPECDEEKQKIEKSLVNDDEANNYRYNLDDDSNDEANNYYNEENMNENHEDSSLNDSVIERPFKRAKRAELDFLDEEADLSGDDIGSDDEENTEEDDYESEEGDEDNVSLNQIREDILKQDLIRNQNENDRELLRLQNHLFADGDLHSNKNRDICFRTRMAEDDERKVDLQKYVNLEIIEDDEEEIDENTELKDPIKGDFIKWQCDQERKMNMSTSLFIEESTSSSVITIEATTTLLQEEDLDTKEPKIKIKKRFSLLEKKFKGKDKV